MAGTRCEIVRQKDVLFRCGNWVPGGQIEDLSDGDTVQLQSRNGVQGPVAFDLNMR